MADAELAQLLGALGSEDKVTRTTAEEALVNGRTQLGFPARLATFAANAAAPPDAFPVRQMALTVLKRLIIERWDALSPDDRGAVQRTLLASLAEHNSNLRGLLHVCAANIAGHNANWPELYTQLGVGMTQGDAREVECCVECITTLLDECGMEVATMLGPLQEPLLRLAAADTTPPALRRLCVQSHSTGVTALIHGEAGEAAIDAVVAALPAWMTVHVALCTGAEGWSDRDHVGCAFSAVRAATQLSRHRSIEATLAAGLLEGLLRPACALVQKIDPAYTQAVIDADDGGVSEEEGGAADFIAQMMELVQAMVVRQKLRVILKGHVRMLLQLLVPFMRITEVQVSSWRADPNEFLAQEEDEHVRGCAVRLSGEGLVGELLAHMKRETGKALAGIVGELLERGERGSAAGETNAWKLAELSLFLFSLAACESPVKALQKGEFAALAPVALNLAGRLCADTSAIDFLRARSFSVLYRLGDAVVALSKGDVPSLLHATARSLMPAEPLVVRVSACRAFCRFLPANEDNALSEALLLEHGVLASLGQLVRDADEELLHLALESLVLVVRACPGAVVKVEASFGTLVLEIWRRTIADPMAHLTVLDLVSCAASKDQQLRRTMEQTMLPSVVNDLRPETDAHITAAAIDLYGVLLKKAEVPFPPSIWSCVEPLLATIVRSDESGLLQNACEALCSVVKRSPAQVVAGGLLSPMLQAIERLLRPDLEDDACLFVGPIVTLLLAHFGSQLSAELATGILSALVQRLARAERPYLQQGLIVVLARLMLEDLDGVLGVLWSIEAQAPMDPKATAGGAAGPVVGRTGLEVLLSVWLANAKEIRAKHARNVGCTAFCRLHAKCSQDARLAGAQTGGPPGTPVALPARLLAALVAGLEFENERVKKLRAAELCDDVDSDEEDDEDDDGDEEEGTKKGGQFGKLLSELVDFEDDDVLSDASGEAGDGDTFQEVERADPFFKLDLQKEILGYLASPDFQSSGFSCPPELSQRAASAVAEARACVAAAPP